MMMTFHVPNGEEMATVAMRRLREEWDLLMRLIVDQWLSRQSTNQLVISIRDRSTSKNLEP